MQALGKLPPHSWCNSKALLASVMLGFLMKQNCWGLHPVMPFQTTFRSALSLSLIPQSRINMSTSSLRRVDRSAFGLSVSASSESPSDTSRPDWALDWMPTWLITLKPIYQLAVAILFYTFHLTVLTQKAFIFPVQLFPSRLGHFTSLGWDSAAGMASLGFYLYLRRSTKDRPNPAVPSLFAAPQVTSTPWKFPSIHSLSRLPGPKSTGVFALFLLVKGYFLTGQFSYFWEDFLYSMAAVGFPMTIPMHRSLVVLLGHLSWIAVGGLILGLVPRPQPFFGGRYDERQRRRSINSTHVNPSNLSRPRRRYRWYTSTWNTYWLWWTVGGYFVSSWFFNLADFVNQMLLPHSLFDSAAEGVVAQLVNPEHNEWFASLIGCLAPCLSAPWWEEILYRGFMLPAMCLHIPYWLAVWLSGVIFSIHHVSATGAIPLMVLGWTWAALYTKSGNLWVTIMVHALWNSRVFLGNWLGL